ncbi:MAG: molybdate ABC transporter substrate-binding protein [Chloroflexaceae bacterium]|nr:molybdate ABC transporter substrate-binding protein [Chloroflexaceae bacterium]
MKRLLLLMSTLLPILVTACGQQAAAPAPTAPAPTATPAPAPTTAAPAAKTELTVFAAASLTDAFTAIGKPFGDANNAIVSFNFAGSQQLAQQLGQGAPADVFASANRAQMDVAISAGRVISGTQQTFVRNRLLVVTPLENRAGIATLQDLAKPGLKLVFADKAVPVGQYSLDFLDKAAQDSSFGAAYKDAVLKNVVSYEQSVRAVLAKVQLGEADAGIIYTSDIALDASKIQRIDIPDGLNTIANFPIAVVKDSKNAVLAQKFVDYVLSAEGQRVLASYGFLPVK